MRGKIVRIIRTYLILSNITLRRVVSQTIMRIIRGMRISEGKIIRAILYIEPTIASGTYYFM